MSDMVDLTVLELMTTEVVTIDAHESLEVAEQIMRVGRIHHLPVLEAGKLVGVITEADLLRANVSALANLPKEEEMALMRSIPVSQAMSRQVKTVGPETPALEAAEILRAHKYGCLPVVSGKRLVGILTEGDFVALVVRALTPLPRAVASA